MNKTNIIIILAAGVIGFALTLYLDFKDGKPEIIEGPIVTEEAPEELVQGDKVPAFSFQTLEGQTFNIRDKEGRIVLLSFWATWCPPCVKEFPLLLEVARQYPDEVTLVAISSDFQEENLSRFLAKDQNKIGNADKNIHIVLDKDSSITRDLFQTFRLPEMIVLDKSGLMRTKFVGAKWTKEEAISVIENINTPS